MLIATYNKHVGDVLMLIVADDQGQSVRVERKGKVAQIKREDTGDIVAWNIFEPKIASPLPGDGQVELTAEDVELLNAELAKSGFSEQITFDGQAKFVIAEILEMEEHPDSDHLHICKVEVGFSEPVQIVCGAPNAAVGLKTVAALPGAMMPNGSLIFPGKLRGVDSFGMLCSARELALPNAPQVRGIIELDASLKAGEKFTA